MLHTLYPKCEACQRCQSVVSLVVFDELRKRLAKSRQIQWQYTTYAAAIAPSTTSVLDDSGRFPLPRPLKLNRSTATSIVVADKLNIRIRLVEIRVRLELLGYEVVQLFPSGRE